MRAIAYLRVSTDAQTDSGHGLSAQADAVARIVVDPQVVEDRVAFVDRAGLAQWSGVTERAGRADGPRPSPRSATPSALRASARSRPDPCPAWAGG
mgnify:CR=1 FL=1